VNGWLWAATALLAMIVPCGLSALRGSAAHRLPGLLVAGPIGSIALLLIAEGTGREPFADLALTLALMSFAGSLLFARFLERLR
jgi:multicomponent Na+:H+ antiporter subunit F